MKQEFSIESAPARTYDVAIDRASLTRADPLGSGQGYSVQLEGPIDANWLESYRLLRVESPSFFRFCLEGHKILFACRAGDVITEVQSILGVLDSLIQLANARATASAPPDY